MAQSMSATQVTLKGQRDSSSSLAAESISDNPLHAPPSTSLAAKLFSILVVTVVIFGWMHREEIYLYTPEFGLGYYLGIAGFTMMILILMYPLRKYVRSMRNWGSVSHYFTLHVVLGTLGPVLILFHANFQVHSLNSSVAFYAMLLVAGSGLIGRFIYTHVHHGLFGRHLTLQELQQLCGMTEDELDHEATIPESVRHHLHEFERTELKRSGSFWLGLKRLILIRPLKTTWVKNKAIHDLRREIKIRAKNERWEKGILRQRYEHDKEIISAFLSAVCRTASFRTYERLFSLWHAVHVPFYILMVLAAIYHIIAVHMY